jgi:hypothetical protein
MNSHNFIESRQYECNCQKRADDFYLKHLGAENIVRYNRNTNADLKVQRIDIDVSFQSNGNYVNISEKFRMRDFCDLYIEFYSKFPNTPGWLDKSQADYIAYFFPKRVFLIDEKALAEFYKNHLSKIVSEDAFERMVEQFPNCNAKKHIWVKIQDHSYKITIIQAYNQIENSSWYTMGIAIKFNVLSDFGIYYKEFVL